MVLPIAVRASSVRSECTTRYVSAPDCRDEKLSDFRTYSVVMYRIVASVASGAVRSCHQWQQGTINVQCTVCGAGSNSTAIHPISYVGGLDFKSPCFSRSGRWPARCSRTWSDPARYPAEAGHSDRRRIAALVSGSWLRTTTTADAGAASVASTAGESTCGVYCTWPLGWPSGPNRPWPTPICGWSPQQTQEACLDGLHAQMHHYA